jgi:hypothetical protein
MSRRRKPRFEPNEGRPPKPRPEGRLDPPRRDPPTAVATAKPKPPSEPYRPTRYGTGVTRIQRTARGFLGSVLVAGGGAAIVLGSASAIVVAGAVVVGVSGAVVTYRALRAPSLFRATDAARRASPRK